MTCGATGASCCWAAPSRSGPRTPCRRAAGAGAEVFAPRPGQRAAARRGAAVTAAGRVGDGLVLVASRHALGALGLESRPGDTPLLDADGLARTRDFLVALARWTRRPAEWAHVPPARAGRRIVLLDSPRPVSPRPPRLAPPARAA